MSKGANRLTDVVCTKGSIRKNKLLKQTKYKALRYLMYISSFLTHMGLSYVGIMEDVNIDKQQCTELFNNEITNNKKYTIREYLDSPQFLVRSVLLIFLVFCVVLCFCALSVFVLCLVLRVSLNYPFLFGHSVFSDVYHVQTNRMQ